MWVVKSQTELQHIVSPEFGGGFEMYRTGKARCHFPWRLRAAHPVVNFCLSLPFIFSVSRGRKELSAIKTPAFLRFVPVSLMRGPQGLSLRACCRP